MLSPKFSIDNNIAYLSFFNRFGELKQYTFSKNNGQNFKLTYTGINAILVLKAYVCAIFDDFAVLRTEKWQSLYSFYGEKLRVGQEVYVIEYFPLHDKRFKWVACTKKHRDYRCIFININILENNRIVKQWIIDPFTGQYNVRT